MKLSIITINYNNASGLEKTIKSILPHLSGEIEYLVIDGGSSDESKSIISNYGEKVDYWVSEKDNGIYNAMNKGIKQAKGDYILFVNSGDTLKAHDGSCKITDNLKDYDIIYYNMEIASPQENASYMKEYPDHPDFKYFCEDTLPHTASFIKKDLLAEYGYYNEKMKIAADWAFFTDAICIQRCSYKHIRECISTFYIDGVSSSPANYCALWDERRQHIKKNYPQYYTLYNDWMKKKDELYKLKNALSVKILRKAGFLKWLR